MSPRRKPPIDTIPLFGEPEPAARPEPAAAAPSAACASWSKYRPKNPVKCDRCMAVLAETGGAGPIAAQAKFRRKAGSVIELLCYVHAEAQRQRDGLPGLRKERR